MWADHPCKSHQINMLNELDHKVNLSSKKLFFLHDCFGFRTQMGLHNYQFFIPYQTGTGDLTRDRTSLSALSLDLLVRWFCTDTGLYPWTHSCKSCSGRVVQCVTWWLYYISLVFAVFWKGIMCVVWCVMGLVLCVMCDVYCAFYNMMAV